MAFPSRDDLFFDCCENAAKLQTKYELNKFLRMERIELVRFNAELLQKLQKAGVKMDDWQYVALVNEYQEMIAQGHKRTYAAIAVAERHGISTRKAYSLLQRLCADCKPPAPE